jgi:ankyrin repeat protein
MGDLSPFHRAVILGQSDVIQMFLRCGVKVSFKTLQGETGLYLSVMHGQLPVAQVLLETSADVNATNAVGPT